MECTGRRVVAVSVLVVVLLLLTSLHTYGVHATPRPRAATAHVQQTHSTTGVVVDGDQPEPKQAVFHDLPYFDDDDDDDWSDHDDDPDDDNGHWGDGDDDNNPWNDDNDHDFVDIRAYDVRSLPTPSMMSSKMYFRSGKVVRRNARSVDGITLHQTAIKFGVAAYQLREAGGDRNLALARRGKTVACHVISFDGIFSKAYPLDYYIYHANSLNRNTLGLEIDGLYPGLQNDKSTLYRGSETTFSKSREYAAKAALKWMVDEGRRMGMPIKYLYAHRQASSTRRSDPGEEIWKKIALDYGVKVLGLEVRPAYKVGSGRTIPTQWDRRNGMGRY